MKRVLFLGGTAQQIPSILKARNLGYYVITCDYLPENPGHKYADEYYNISTTDKLAVLKLAEKLKIDGICYAADSAAQTAAYVAEEMGLPGNPYKSAVLLTEKDKFRSFLAEHGFCTPLARGYSSVEEAKKDIVRFRMPVLIKPVDSAGCSGVNKLADVSNLEKQIEHALNFSRAKRFIIEEFIEHGTKYDIGGNCFVLNGKVEFWTLLNNHVNPLVNPLMPAGKSHPLQMNERQIEEVHNTVQRAVDLLGIKFGGLKLELMFDKCGRLYLIEMNPRLCGNMIPELLQMITGVDLIAAAVEATLGNTNIDLHYEPQDVFYANHIIHTAENGIYENIEFSTEIEKRIVKKVILKKPGDPVQFFDRANKAIGYVFMKFLSKEEMLELMDHIQEHINIKISSPFK
jgi:biotin carboxylase